MMVTPSCAVSERPFAARPTRFIPGSRTAEQFERVEPLEQVDDPEPFPCTGGIERRHPRQTKGHDYDATIEAGECCEPGSCC